MGMARRVKAYIPHWPWHEIFGFCVAILFVVILSVIGIKALILAGKAHLPQKELSSLLQILHAL
ncbi:hypothetical protein [Swingsia samuiensis]|uniref:Uncharacterized protein n=1 Tax=Swingsia samuiensis TaxID=1293412 RepID=A0A4Y6UKJ7_9PROT|nr:hypothetical protein [Swingsia samuiensis]QDH17168.1 hypothetical protein E3D00_06005 [Swingsia samuiensis]